MVDKQLLFGGVPGPWCSFSGTTVKTDARCFMAKTQLEHVLYWADSDHSAIVVTLEEPPYDPPSDDLIWVVLPSDWGCWVPKDRVKQEPADE
jgi:hypothetical protein